MQAHVSSARTVTGRNTQMLKALSGAVLAVAVATSAAIWQSVAHEGGQQVSTVALPADGSAVTEPLASVFGSSATPRQIVAATSSPVPIIYITDSEEEANYLRRFSAEINALASEAGRTARGVTVLVAVSADDDAAIQAQIAQIHNVQDNMGLPVTQVFDLRAG
jgi:hypothetical protein